jgi:phosphopantetheinyl transferase
MPRCLPVRATEGIVHVWQANLAGAEADGLEDLLCAEELARAARIIHERHRRPWIRSRGILRALLGRYLDRDPRELRFSLGPYGKPRLEAIVSSPDRVSGPDCVDLRFNLSHSGTLALYAVSAGREVGVDIECARERYTAQFLREWVAREAAVKCRGTGLGATSRDSPTAELWTAELDVGPQAAAAVTVEGERCELRCWEWRG